jgi:transcriptional regulator with PAS, ATPase and Fis domain
MLDVSPTGLLLSIPEGLKLRLDERVMLRLPLSENNSYELGTGIVHHTARNEDHRVLGIEFKDQNPFFAWVGMLGISPRILEIKSLLPKIISSGLNILICGETGTGKNVLAKLIHNMRRGEQQPFIRVNCPSIPDSLFESELFGHEKGAFTDAKSSTPGFFRLAAEGTILLDEISEIQPHLQAKLLSVIEDKEFVPVGGDKLIPVRANIIATSNLDLEKAVEEGRFRRDLYYRLCEIPVLLPSLSERKEDVALLAHYFLQSYCEKFGRPFRMFSDAEIEILKNHSWPGNIRELENYIKQMALMDKFVEPKGASQHGTSAKVGLETMDFLDDLLAEENTLPELTKKMTEQIERVVIMKMLETCSNNKTCVAGRLGISYRTLLRKFEQLHLS